MIMFEFQIMFEYRIRVDFRLSGFRFVLFGFFLEWFIYTGVLATDYFIQCRIETLDR